MAKITIKDVAKKCKVSVSTVSRAINNHSEINPKTRKQILDTIEEMGYIPNTNARNLKLSQSNVIVVLIKGIGNTFYQPMFSVLESQIRQKGYSFLLQKVEEKDNELEVALQLVNDKRLKGIIFLGGFLVHDRKQLDKITVPFVITTIINKNLLVGNCACVGVDDEKESQKMTEYLIEKGHKKIAIIGGRTNDKSIGMLRMNGYKNALKKHNIKFDQDLVFTESGDLEPYTFQYGYTMATRLLEKKVEFTAIYCMSDTIAIGVMKRLNQEGLNCPKDYSLAGFDGIQINQYLTPSITTIKQPVEQMAKAACESLFNMIDQKEFENVITFEGTLWEGQTTSNIK